MFKTGAPCMKCNQRHTACHDSCPAYLKWKNEREAGRKKYMIESMWGQEKIRQFNLWLKGRNDPWRRV